MGINKHIYLLIYHSNQPFMKLGFVIKVLGKRKTYSPNGGSMVMNPMVESRKTLATNKHFGRCERILKGYTWRPYDTPFLQEGKASTYKIPIPFSKLCQGLNSIYWAIPPLIGNAYDKYINLYFFGWWRSVRKPIVRPDPTTGSVLIKSDAVDHLTQLAPLFEPVYSDVDIVSPNPK